MSHDRVSAHGISARGLRLCWAVGLVAALSVGPAFAGALEYLPDHLLESGGLTAGERSTPPGNLFSAFDDLDDIYHALGDPGLVSERIDITQVSIEMWDLGGGQDDFLATRADILEAFWGGWDPALEATDDIVRFRPAAMPDFQALSPWAVITVTTAMDTPAWTRREALESPMFYEFPVGWAGPGVIPFHGAVGDLFNGTNYVTGLGSDASGGLEVFDLAWDGQNWLPMDSQTLVAAYGNQITYVIPIGADVVAAGPINVNIGSFANFGTDVNFDPAEGGVDLLQTSIDFGVDVPVFPIDVLMPGPVAVTTSSTTTTSTTQAPAATTAAPAATPDQTPTAVVDDGGGIPLWAKVMVGLIVLGLLGGMFMAILFAPARLTVGSVVPGTAHTLCKKMGCNFWPSGVCKGTGTATCGKGCTCRTFSRVRGPRWDGTWKLVPGGRPKGRKARAGLKFYCLCVSP